uniref:Uncharacterized protein n=1 Tax=Anguilla anguilla TaxID=7936 RepID=A0A0E9WDD1_ANGAN
MNIKSSPKVFTVIGNTSSFVSGSPSEKCVQVRDCTF